MARGLLLTEVEDVVAGDFFLEFFLGLDGEASRSSSLDSLIGLRGDRGCFAFATPDFFDDLNALEDW